jgi:hypothetical protein
MNNHYKDLKVTSGSTSAASAIHDFSDALVSHGSNISVVFEALLAEPECALANAFAAGVHLTRMTRDGQRRASPLIEAAQRHARHATPRERQFVEAIAAWGRGEDRAAVGILRSIVEVWPHDLVAAKFCQILEIGIGDFVGMRRTSAMAAAVEGRSGYALGLHAYALEQMGDPELALRFGRKAMERNPGMDPWAQHAVAHALVAMDQPHEARVFLRAHAPDWDRCSSFMLTHNWWHLALCDLELENPAGALALFDERVWGMRKEHCQDQINAISLLARLEMRGAAVGWRWNDIATHIEGQIEDRISGFLDLHYLYALVRGGRVTLADKMLQAMEGQSVLGALARGIMAYCRREYQAAAASIAPIVRHIGEIGGSNIQRELFESIFYDSVMRTRTSETLRVAA